MSSTGALAAHEPVEYTLTVEEPDGSEVGSTTVTDCTPLEEFGGHVLFESLGDRSYDDDHGYVDSLRYGSGDVVENWEERTLEDYELVEDGGGEAAIVSEPVEDGENALEQHTGKTWTTYVSDEAHVAIEDGVEILGAVRNETDDSSSYAMRTGFGVGVDADGEGGLRVQLNNPGSQRTAGAQLDTPNERAFVEFTPELETFYTLRIAVDAGAEGACSHEEDEEEGNERDSEDGSDEDEEPNAAPDDGSGEDGDDGAAGSEGGNGDVAPDDGSDVEIDEVGPDAADSAEEGPDGETGDENGNGSDEDDGTPGFGALAAVASIGGVLAQRLYHHDE